MWRGKPAKLRAPYGVPKAKSNKESPNGDELIVIDLNRPGEGWGYHRNRRRLSANYPHAISHQIFNKNLQKA